MIKEEDIARAAAWALEDHIEKAEKAALQIVDVCDDQEPLDDLNWALQGIREGYEDLCEKAWDAVAALENILLHHGERMSPADFESRLKVMETLKAQLPARKENNDA